MVLSTNPAIKRLNLESCGIHDAGVEARWSYLAAVKGVGPKIAGWGNAADYV